MAIGDRKLDIIRLDYEKTLASIDKTDGLIFKIRNWAILAASGVIAYSLTKLSILALFLNLFVILAFLFVELIYKGFHEEAIRHSSRLEHLIFQIYRDEYLSDEEYVFGLGHAITPPSLQGIVKILRSGARWHIGVLYGLGCNKKCG